MPSSASATKTATWNWVTNDPAGIQSIPTIQNTTATITSSNGVVLTVDATASGAALRGQAGNAQFNEHTKLLVPVVSTHDVVTFVANGYGYAGVIIGDENFPAGDPVVLTRTHTATKDDVAQGYVVIESKGGYVNTVSVELAYMPASAISAVWDWHNGIPASITSSVAEGTDASGSIKSNNNLSLDYLGATSGVYVKLQYNENSGNPYAQFNTNTAIHIPVTSSSDILTVVSYPGQYNYKVGGVAATGNTTIHKATSDEVTAGYIEILATATAYLYSISLEKRASVTIGSTGWATFSYTQPTDFTNLTGVVDAYQVTGFTGTAINKSSVTTVAAEKGLLLNAAAGTYAIPLTDSGDALFGNQLVAQTAAGTVTAAGTGYRNYVLVAPGGTVAFKSVTGTNTASIGAGKAYLHLDISGGAPSANFLYFDDETTGVNAIEGQMEEARGDFFDLQGRKVAQPTKGLYIVNGKKVIIK